MKTVAVVTPLYKEGLTQYEEISFRHLRHYLGCYDRFLTVPDSLKVSHPDFKIIRFNDWHFKNIDSYSKLLLSSEFYRQFSEYEYILTYQPDCLVFSGDLLKWCGLGYDYIGAPWLKDADNAKKGFSRVGNGGLSLRKVSSFINVLESARYVEEKVGFWKEAFFVEFADIQDMPFPLRLYKRLSILSQARRGASAYASSYTLNEDHFWSDRAGLFSPDFKIAPLSVALSFSFERAPEYCYEKNNYNLPFGCHGWWRWDRNFWQNYLLK